MSNLSVFPNLATVKIGFAYPFHRWFCDEHWPGLSFIDPSLAWRKLVFDIYNALSINESPQHKSLEIRNWAFTYIVPFESPRMHKLLGKMERFAISIRGAETRNNITSEVYADTMGLLDGLFFNHLEQTEHLTFRAPRQGPIGRNCICHIPLALNASQTPKLKSLTLEYLFISIELLRYVIGHASTLEELILYNCAASISDLAGNFYPHLFRWKDFFAGMTAANFPNLHRVEIEPRALPVIVGAANRRVKVVEPDKLKESFEMIRRVRSERTGVPVEKGTHDKLFSYVSLTEDGKIYYRARDNLRSHNEGADLESYDKLVAEMRRHASISGREIVLR